MSGPVVPVSDECDAGDHRTAHNESVSFPVRPRRYWTRRRTPRNRARRPHKPYRLKYRPCTRAPGGPGRGRGSAPGRPPVSVPARARARAAVRRMAGRAGWVRAVGQIYRYRRGSVGARRAAHDRVVRIAPAHPDRFRARDRVADRPNPREATRNPARLGRACRLSVRAPVAARHRVTRVAARRNETLRKHTRAEIIYPRRPDRTVPAAAPAPPAVLRCDSH